jgi:hypothetical protein
VPEECPDNARHLGGECDGDGVGMDSRKQTAQPVTETRAAAAQGRQGCTGALDQHLAQVFTAAFGDAKEAGLASCRRLPREKPEPSGKITASRKGPSIADRSNESGSIESADAGDGYQPAGGRQTVIRPLTE